MQINFRLSVHVGMLGCSLVTDTPSQLADFFTKAMPVTIFDKHGAEIHLLIAYFDYFLLAGNYFSN